MVPPLLTIYGHAGLALVAVVLSVWSWCAMRGRPLAIIGAVINGVVLCPWVLLVVMWKSGGSPVAQLNGPVRGWWSLWFDLWPMFMLVLLASCLAWITLVIAGVVQHFRSASRMTWLLALQLFATGAHVVLTLFWIGPNMPDA